MKSTDRVSHGSSSDLNQPHGDWVSGVYPSGGTHEKTNEWWKRLWLSRLTTSPSQKTGIEIPISPMIITNASIGVPRNTAAISPIAMLTSTQITAAPSTSDSVTGAAWV